MGVLLAFSDNRECDKRDDFKNDQTEFGKKKPEIEVLQLEVKSVVIEN